MGSIGSRLEELRTAADITRVEMAARAGASKQHYGRIVSGQIAQPAPEWLAKWAAHFGVRMEWLSTGKGPKKAVSSQSQSARPSPETLHLAFQSVVAALSDTDVKPESVLADPEGAEFVAGAYELLANGMTPDDLQHAPEMDALARKYVGTQRGGEHAKQARSRGRSSRVQ